MNTKTIDREVRALRAAVKATPGGYAQDESMNEFHRKVGALMPAWMKYLAATHLPAELAHLADLVFAKAYTDGHHAGFYEIESHYGELADFASDLAAAVLKAAK
jgi:hypothetical protein